MKKALLFFFFLNLFFIQTSHAFFLVTNQENSTMNSSSKNTIENKLNFKNSFFDSFFYKSEIIVDNDNDNEEAETQNTSITKNTSDTTINYFNTIVGTIDFAGIKACPKTYYSENTSRLPRFNYISLRVLRL